MQTAMILYGGHGGAARGFELAGWRAFCIDLAPSPRNPYPVLAADAIGALETLLDGGRLTFSDGTALALADVDAFCAHPPCQAFSQAQRIRGNVHPDLVAATRALLRKTGKPYVLENVPGAPLENPIMLCGAMFPGVRVYRHRLFETSFAVQAPPHPPHTAKQVKMGRAPAPGEWIQAVGNFTGVAAAREAMGCPWMNRDGLRLTVPPAMIEYIANHIER